MPAGQLPRDTGQVILESHVTEALIRLNPAIAAGAGPGVDITPDFLQHCVTMTETARSDRYDATDAARRI